MADDPLYMAYLLDMADLKVLWSSVARWMSVAARQGLIGKQLHPHECSGARRLADNCMQRYDVAVEHLIRKCHEAKFKIGFFITGPEESDLKRRPSRRKAA